jgi:hypothetical protein
VSHVICAFRLRQDSESCDRMAEGAAHAAGSLQTQAQELLRKSESYQQQANTLAVVQDM